MNRILGLAILATIGLSFQAQSQTRAAECRAIASVFQSAGEGYQLSGNINDALGLADRLVRGIGNLNLQDPKLRSLQGRYIAYLNSSTQLLRQGQQNQNNETVLNALITSARAISALGHSLGQELVDYCLQ